MTHRSLTQRKKHFVDEDDEDSGLYLDKNRIDFEVLGEPYIEYTSTDQILTDIFPFIFYRGYCRNRGDKARGPLNLKDRRRLFLYYDRVAATNISLLTYVFDAHRRSCAMSSARVKTKGNFNTVHRTLDSFRKFVLCLPVGANINDARFANDLSREMKKLRKVISLHSPPVP